MKNDYDNAIENVFDNIDLILDESIKHKKIKIRNVYNKHIIYLSSLINGHQIFVEYDINKNLIAFIIKEDHHGQEEALNIAAYTKEQLKLLTLKWLNEK